MLTCYITHTKTCMVLVGGVSYDDKLNLYRNIITTKNLINMEKKIIGYKWKEGYEDKYLPAALAIIETPLPLKYWKTKMKIEDFLIDKTTFYSLRLQQTGVLGLWFEPVYEETPQYKVGDWVVGLVDLAGRVIYYIGKYISPTEMGNWSLLAESYDRARVLNGGLFTRIERHATEEEIRTRLLAEAKIRGYGCGVKVRSCREKIEHTIAGNLEYIKTEYRKAPTKNNIIASTKDELTDILIYSDEYGWAEILPSTPQIEINGYKAEFKPNKVSFGCEPFSHKTINKINHILNDLGVDLTKEKHKIKELVEYINTNKNPL